MPHLFELWNTDLTPEDLNLPIMRALELDHLPMPMMPICQFDSEGSVEEVVWALEDHGLLVKEVWEGSQQYTLWVGKPEVGAMVAGKAGPVAGYEDDVEPGIGPGIGPGFEVGAQVGSEVGPRVDEADPRTTSEANPGLADEAPAAAGARP